jgi:heat shock protein HtpX
MTTANTLKTVFLLALLTALFIFIGRALFGVPGMMLALAFAVLMNGAAYWFSDKIALSMAGAREVSPAEAPELHRIVEELASYARMPKPRVYIIDSPTPNAFATGRDPQHAAVAATTGILHLLSPQELAGVMAHELAHIRNRDTLIATVVATIAGAITQLAYMAQWALMFGGFRGDDEEEGGGIAGLVGGLLLVILAPIAAVLIQMAISRAREYQADAIGARILGNPHPLADALEKLEAGAQMVPAQVNPATAHLYIVNPLHGGLAGLFSTHPPTEERIRRLREMAYQPGAYGVGF